MHQERVIRHEDTLEARRSCFGGQKRLAPHTYCQHQAQAAGPASLTHPQGLYGTTPPLSTASLHASSDRLSLLCNVKTKNWTLSELTYHIRKACKIALEFSVNRSDGKLHNTVAYYSLRS